MKKKLQLKPTQTILIGFALIILIGSLLLNLPLASKSGQSIGFIDAAFTSTSAVCVTGLVVVDTYSHWSLFGQIVILLLIQIGGLGFMTMATLFSFMLKRRISLKERLIIAESYNQYTLQGIIKLVRRVLIATFIIESIGAFLLSLRFIQEVGVLNGIYKGIFHAVSAFCNAGFDIMGQGQPFSSLTAYSGDIIVNLIITSLIIVGGLGFVVWDDIYNAKSYKKLHFHSKIVLFMTGSLLVFGFFSFLLLEFNNGATLASLSGKDKILVSFFQSVTPRTAGFNTVNFADMRKASVLITMLLMFIGAAPGSTGGGIKITTFGVLLLTAISVIKGREDTEIFKRRISSKIVTRALTITLLALLLVFTATVILASAENITLAEALFEAISAFATVGLSLGITTELAVVSKITLIATMFIGRIGILTVVLALMSRAQDKNASYRYREERIMLG